MPLISLVVPALPLGGGVPAVARFLHDTIERSGRYEAQVISLNTSSRDVHSRMLRAPTTWGSGVRLSRERIGNISYTHVGTNLSELEFQRYLPRPELSALIRKADIVQVVAGSPCWANAVVGQGVPISLQVATRAKVERRWRSSVHQSAGDRWRRLMTHVTDRLDDRGIRRVEAIQVENPWMLAYCNDVGDPTRQDIRYAPPGINAVTFQPSATDRLQKKPYVLCVGRLADPRKNISLLLRAFALMPEDLRNAVELKLAGSSAPSDAFWTQAEKLGIRAQVQFVDSPSQDALVELYQSAHSFVLPSDEEGLGIVALEAMSCGIPVVATRSGGPDGIITDGVDGFLTPLNDANTLADRLTRLLTDTTLNRSMGSAARATILSRYEERKAGSAFVDVWDRLIQKQV